MDSIIAEQATSDERRCERAIASILKPRCCRC
jgi:hypothetical protein